MKLSEMLFNTIRVGQVVCFDHSQKFAWVCRLDATFRPGDTPYKAPREDEVFVQHESGNVSQIFHMLCDHVEVIEGKIIEPKDFYKAVELLKTYHQ